MKLLPNLFNWVQNLVEAFTFYGSSGGGGGGSQTSTSYSTNLPEYAKPYYQELLKQTGKQIYTTDSAGNVTGVQGMPQYTGERVAGFTPEQLQTQQNVMNMQQPGGFGVATRGLGAGQQLAYGSALSGLGQALGYTPQDITSQSIAGPSLNTYQMQAAPDVYAERARSQAFTPMAAQQYMSPYQQNVTDIALREARRQGALEQQAGALGSIGRGTFGGARQALMQAEQKRNLAQNLGDIQAKGSQAGYTNAQQQFLADQANRMAAQQLNVQSGLQASLANQQAQQTAAQQNLAAQLGVQQLGAGQSLEAQKANQAAALQAQQLSQQGQQYAAGLGKDVGLAGLSQGIEASAKQAATAAAQQTADLERLKAQAATGAEKQAYQQKIDDLAYQQFMEKQNYQKQQLEYLSNILRGNAAALGSTQTQYTPAPSMASQIAGMGLAGISLANVLGKG